MQRDLAALAGKSFDVAIVGGGIHGAWIALRAVRAGYRVALIERDDFGGATSANSLKILHGGLRYLQHLDFKRMRASIRARREFGRLSPHLVRPLSCVIPLQAAGVRSPWILGPALIANDVISVDRNSGVGREARLPYGRLVSAKACRDLIAPLNDVDAVAGAMWWDAVALDAARLTLEPILKAAQVGAVIANRVEAQSYLIGDGAIKGVAALDRLSGKTFEIRASVVVNATGPWGGELSAAAGLPTGFMPSTWVGGLNIVLRRSLGIDTAIALSSVSKAADGSAVLRRSTRELFFVPWRGVTMVGTDYFPIRDVTEGVAGPPSAAVEKFVVEVAAVAPRANVSADDVALVHWGALPSDDSGSGLPRKSAVLVAGARETGAKGLVVVVGEKLTSAPVLAQQVLKRVVGELAGAPSASSKDAQQPVELHDIVESSTRSIASGDARARLAARYGDEWTTVALHAEDRPELFAPIHPSVSARGVEILHAIRHEMALSLDDIVLRRLALADIGHPGEAVLRRCAEIAAPELAWDAARIQREVAALDELLHSRGARLAQRAA